MKSTKNKCTGSLLWWGRFDPEYSRNRVVLSLFRKLGWKVDFFQPLSSRTGSFEAYFRRPQKPDLVWSPCFRQTDIDAAASWARKWQVPLIIDPLISAYQKEVFERCKYPPESPKARKRKEWESRLFSRADVVVADTPAHADFFRETLGVAQEQTEVLYVAAEGDHFTPMPFPTQTEPVEVLFYGSFLALQGVDVVIQAAKKSTSLPIRWTLIGDGDLRPEMERMAGGAGNIFFEPWVDYGLLPKRLSRAHILLGIFGTTPKADLVIPNKMFQSMAVGRPVITRQAEAYRGTLAGEPVIGWVPPGDPDALAGLVLKWAQNTETLKQRGLETRTLFDKYFSPPVIKKQLQAILENAMQP